MKHNMRINGNVKQIDCKLGSDVRDKNGVEIFDGDIIRHYNGTEYKVRFSKGAFELVYVNVTADDQSEYLSDCLGSEFVVIPQIDGVVLDDRLVDELLLDTKNLSGYNLIDENLKPALTDTVEALYDKIHFLGTFQTLKPLNIVSILVDNLERHNITKFSSQCFCDMTNIFCFVIAFNDFVRKTIKGNSED